MCLMQQHPTASGGLVMDERPGVSGPGVYPVRRGIGERVSGRLLCDVVVGMQAMDEALR